MCDLISAFALIISFISKPKNMNHQKIETIEFTVKSDEGIEKFEKIYYYLDRAYT